MKLTPEQRRIARAILQQPDDGLVALTRLTGMDPATVWVGADLRGVVCTEDVTGFVFRDADLRGADFRRARGKTAAMFAGATVDAATRGLPPAIPDEAPADFDIYWVRGLVLDGRAIPDHWIQFVANLDLSGVRLTDLSSLARLTALQSLQLAGTEVSDVRPLAGLTALQYLSLAGTEVSDVTPLAVLTALQYLRLDGTPVSDVTPLAGLTALQRLDLTSTQVSDVTPLAGLTALQTLWLDGTRVSDVTPLAGLQKLTIYGGLAARKPLRRRPSLLRRLLRQKDRA